MAEDNDFASQLGSLDAEQLQALLNEMDSRNKTPFALSRPQVADPKQYKGIGVPGSGAGAGLPGANGGSVWYGERNGQSESEMFKDSAGRLSVVGQYKHYKRSKKAKAARAEHAAAMEAENQRQKKIMGERMTMVKNQIGTLNMRGKVNQQFRDMDLEGLFDRVTKQGLDSSLIGITQQHDDLSRNTGFQAAAQGIGGGSADAERIADVQSSQDQASAQAAAQAQMHNRQMRTSADQTRQSLLNSVSGSNPGEQARLSGEMANIQNNANSFVNQAGLTQYGMQQGQQNMAGQSQALGGLLSNYANMYSTNNDRR